jgi:hypothetical protein
VSGGRPALLVVPEWRSSKGESETAWAARQLAVSLAREFAVAVVRLDQPGSQEEEDGAFSLLPLRDLEPSHLGAALRLRRAVEKALGDHGARMGDLPDWMLDLLSEKASAKSAELLRLVSARRFELVVACDLVNSHLYGQLKAAQPGMHLLLVPMATGRAATLGLTELPATKRLVASANEVVAFSEHEAALLTSLVPAATVVTFRPPFYVNEALAAKRPIDVPDDRYYVVLAKGMDRTAALAISRLTAAMPASAFCVVTERRCLVARGPRRFLGPTLTGEADLIRLMGHAAAVVDLTRPCLTGRTAAQSLLLRRPTLVSSHHPLADLVRRHEPRLVFQGLAEIPRLLVDPAIPPPALLEALSLGNGADLLAATVTARRAGRG